MSEPWGWRGTISITVENPRDGRTGRHLVAACEAAADVLRDAGYVVNHVGARVDPVHREPYDK